MFIELTGEAGFGINSTIKVSAATSEQSQMRCDAMRRRGGVWRNGQW